MILNLRYGRLYRCRNNGSVGTFVSFSQHVYLLRYSHITNNYSQQAVAHDAFRALVNLSDSPMLVNSLAEPTFLNFLVSYIIVRCVSLQFSAGRSLNPDCNLSEPTSYPS